MLTNDKQRFGLKDVNYGNLQICAHQGHTVDVIGQELERITSAA